MAKTKTTPDTTVEIAIFLTVHPNNLLAIAFGLRNTVEALAQDNEISSASLQLPNTQIEILT